MNPELDQLAIQYMVCPRCEARPGEECETLSGEEAHRTHSSRVKPLALAYNKGLTANASTPLMS